MSTRHVGPPRVLGRYTAHGEPRLLIGQRLDDHVRLYDKPDPNSHSPSRSFLIEPGPIGGRHELDGLINAYLQHAEAIDDIPMRATGLGLGEHPSSGPPRP